MGHLVGPWESGLDPVKADLFESMGRPRTGKEVESFVGFVNFLRDYIPLYSKVMAPIEKLRKVKGVIGEERWGESRRGRSWS
jgi:hypothetical protein